MMPRWSPFFALAALGCAKSSGPKTASEEWWLLEDPDDAGDEDDEDEDEDDDDDDDEDDDESLPAGTTLWGEALLSGDGIAGGALGVVIVGEDGALVCEVEYTIAAATPAMSCAACSFAFHVEVGEELFAEDEDGRCAAGGHLDMTGQVLGVGQANGAFHVEQEGTWVEAGWSEVEGEDWFFAGSLDE